MILRNVLSQFSIVKCFSKSLLVHSTRPANTKNDDSGIEFEGFYFKIKNIVHRNHSYSKNAVLCYDIFLVSFSFYSL